jgi:hypothetical protein
LLYDDIPDDNFVDNLDVELSQGSSKELAAAIECLGTSAEQAGMSRDGVQSLRKLITEYEDDFKLKLGADSPAILKPLLIKLREVA